MTTIGRLLFEESIPPEVRRGIGESVSSSDVKTILARTQEVAPEKYKDISYKLLRLGMKGSTETNTSFSLEDLKSPVDKKRLLKEIRRKEEKIHADKNLTPEQKQKAVIDLYYGYATKMPDMVFDEAMRRGSNLARMVASGARGNKSQLNSNIGADFLVADFEGRPIPVPITRNYAEGLTPAEYFAAGYGTRLGLVAAKFAVQDGGFYTKQLLAATEDLIVTEDDCGSEDGLLVDPGDSANYGSVLARSVGPIKAGTVIDKKVAAQLKKYSGGKKVVVRSPITCRAKHGVCSKCAGVREYGRFPKIGEPVGQAASTGVSEPVQQSLLSTKHSAGVVSAGGGANVTGFNVINALSQVPSTFPQKAVVSEEDGRIAKIADAPQGGWEVVIGDTVHYVPGERELIVKEGDEVEAGDVLSSGIPNPADIVRHKGVGEGRRYWVEAMENAIKAAKGRVDRRNLEMVAKAVIDHVEADDDLENDAVLPGDVVTYTSWASGYKKHPKTQKLVPKAAKGQYLQAPALHYTIGTKVRPKMIKDLEEVGVDAIEVAPEAPSFRPRMVRLMDNPSFKKDWMIHTGYSYAKRNLKSDVQGGGAESLIHGPHFSPSLARGVEFGRPPEKDSPWY